MQAIACTTIQSIQYYYTINTVLLYTNTIRTCKDSVQIWPLAHLQRSEILTRKKKVAFFMQHVCKFAQIQFFTASRVCTPCVF